MLDVVDSDPHSTRAGKAPKFWYMQRMERGELCLYRKSSEGADWTPVEKFFPIPSPDGAFPPPPTYGWPVEMIMLPGDAAHGMETSPQEEEGPKGGDGAKKTRFRC